MGRALRLRRFRIYAARLPSSLMRFSSNGFVGKNEKRFRFRLCAYAQPELEMDKRRNVNGF